MVSFLDLFSAWLGGKMLQNAQNILTTEIGRGLQNSCFLPELLFFFMFA